MKKFTILVILAIGFLFSSVVTDAKEDAKKKDEFQRKSEWNMPAPFVDGTSYPRNFNETNNARGNGAISTGYYFFDNKEGAIYQKWLPNVEVADTNVESGLWRKIDAGPRSKGKDYWTNNPPEGMAFFRNPADKNIFSNPIDTVDDAFAGPIPLKIDGGFYFNGIRYDSFYVSTNGIIALSNRRYYYDEDGNRTIPEGAKNAYDPNSMDWFVIGDQTIGNQYTGIRGRAIKTDSEGNPLTDGQGNWITEDGLENSDFTKDNYGHFYMAIGQNPDDMTQIPGANDGIRAVPNINVTNSVEDIMPANRKGAIIAPFWGDLHLSQFNDNLQDIDGFGKVYYKRSADRSKVIIAIYNIAPKGVTWWWDDNGNEFKYDALMNLRPGHQDFIAADCQVILDSKDSSVTIIYPKFHGSLKSIPGSYDDLPDSVSAEDIFKFNTIAGVVGPARYVKNPFTLQNVPENDYNYPWEGEYVQYTNYYSNIKDRGFDLFKRGDTLAVKFKQWQNTLKATNVHYRVRSENPNDDLSFSQKIPFTTSDYYELLAGEKRLGAIQPVGLIQNLTNDIQGENGVNYIEQDLEFQARLRIVNKTTGRSIYNKMVYVSDRCLDLDDGDAIQCVGDENTRVRLARTVSNQGNGNYNVSVYSPSQYRSGGYTGVPPYDFAQITFPPFEPNKFFDNNIGSHRSYLIAEPKQPGTGISLGDQWPFDDTLTADLFVLRRIETFNDDVTEFHLDLGRGIAIPSTLKWVNINAEVVSGEDVSKHPLAPRGEYGAYNQPEYKLTSPVIKMNRLTFDGQEPSSKFADSRGYNGDEIRSYPIDMRGKYGSILSIAVQRAQYRDDWERDYMDNELVGPEPRTIFTTVDDNTSFEVFDNDFRSVAGQPDELVVEFARPSSDGLTGLINDVDWSYHPRPDGQAPITNNPALTVFGAGGYMVGFLEEDPNVPLRKPNRPNYNGLRPDRYDDGIDFEYKKFFIQIPDTFINWENEAAKNFRFRVKVLATNDTKSIIPDDADDFFVDNIRILTPAEVTDIEVTSVTVDWPYTLIPASQATSVPLSVNVSNNTSLDAPVFAVKVKIHRLFKDSLGNVTIEKNPIYCRLENIGNLYGGNALDVSMPSWNVRKSQIDTSAWYRIYALSLYPGEDLIPNNDTTYTDIEITFGDEFAYDRDPKTDTPDNPLNDVPDEMDILGRGLNLFGSNYAEAIGGRGFSVDDRAGTQTGTGSGQIAVKFKVLNTDTLRGFRAFYGNLNSYPDIHRLRVYKNDYEKELPNPDSLMAEIIRSRLVNDGENVLRTNQFITYLLNEPLILSRGTYWITVEQPSGKRGLQLGASKSRSAMRVTKFFEPNDGDGTTIDTFGTEGLNLLIDKSFRKMTVDGRLVNENYFAYENISDSRNWVPFTPEMGNPAYPHFSHYGFFANTMTLSGGTWIPLLRPYFGYKSHGAAANEYQLCPDVIPVEIMSFDADIRKNGVDLIWETASETNNYGFYIERRIYDSENESKWNELNFVSGKGNSNIAQRYNYFDNSVANGETYQYRIKQVDFDGTSDCSSSGVITLTYDFFAEAELLPNYPNPFDNSTSIRFILPRNQKINIEIMDVYGNLIKNINVDDATKGQNMVHWNGLDKYGSTVANGTYIYRVYTEDKVLTGKMTLLK